MKASEITLEDRTRWEEKWIIVACRICNEVMLYPKPTYKPEMFIGWECQMRKRRNV